MLKLFSLLSSLCPTHQQDVLTPIYRFKVGTCLLMTSPCHASYCISWQTLLWEKNGCLIILLVMTLPYRVQGLPISISSVHDPCRLGFPSVRSLGSSRSIFLPGRWPRQHSRLAPLSERYWIFPSSCCSLVCDALWTPSCSSGDPIFFVHSTQTNWDCLLNLIGNGIDLGDCTSHQRLAFPNNHCNGLQPLDNNASLPRHLAWVPLLQLPFNKTSMKLPMDTC